MITLTALLDHGAFVVHPTILFAIILGYVLFNTFSYAVNPSTASFWASKPSVGWQKQWFSGLRATWRSLTQSQSMIADGYIKVRMFFRGTSRNISIILLAIVF